MNGGVGWLFALAHKILVLAYYLLKNDCSYRDLGSDYFDRLNLAGLKRSLVRRLEPLGHTVVLLPA